MQVSLIVATLDRQKDLRNTLESISQSTLLPDEVIVVEQGDVKKTKHIVDEFRKVLRISVYYFETKSLSQARNFGIGKSRGEILCFFDDDIELDVSYIQHAKNFLNTNPRVMGLNGRDLLSLKKNHYFSRVFRRLFGVMFMLSSFAHSNKVLRSGQNILRNNSDNMQNIEWLSGCNMVIRKQVFEEGLSFNDTFARWSFGEDVMLSYQIFKKYGAESLVYLPQLELKHFQSTENRLPSSQKMKMQVVYRYIFWKQEIYKSNLDRVAFVLSQIGFTILHLLKTKDIKELKILFSSYRYIINHSEGLKNNTIDFNAFIF